MDTAKALTLTRDATAKVNNLIFIVFSLYTYTDKEKNKNKIDVFLWNEFYFMDYLVSFCDLDLLDS
ncbi:hypothetical protein OS31_43640 [Dickeya oryzae]